jgi:hypothetical protein
MSLTSLTAEQQNSVFSQFQSINKQRNLLLIHCERLLCFYAGMSYERILGR